MSKEFKITKSNKMNFKRYSLEATQDVFLYGEDDMQVSDGYHTMDELYEHRIVLFIALCEVIAAGGFYKNPEVWRTKRHSDGKLCFDTGTQFVLGIGKEKGKQITYHLPLSKWDQTDFAETLENAPEWDGHSSSDVLERLSKL